MLSTWSIVKLQDIRLKQAQTYFLTQQKFKKINRKAGNFKNLLMYQAI